jgi:pyrroloquinoline quinone (PQQ) biosynthesis protein C
MAIMPLEDYKTMSHNLCEIQMKENNMEYLTTPYGREELSSDKFKNNKRFLEELEKKMLGHSVFDHPFLKKFSAGMYTQEGAEFVLKQFGKIVKPFTAAVCKLMGNSPDIKSRFMLMDNLYEEMGHNNLNECHPVLYLAMLESIGITQDELDKTPTISGIRVLNNTIFDAVANKDFAIGCSWLGYGGELTIPNNFPYLVQGTKKAFEDSINMGFWERHGERDQEHSDDATTVLCMNCDETQYADIEEAVRDSLNLRARIWDELENICDAKYINISVINGKETYELPPEYKVLSEYYYALNNADISKMKENWSKDETAAFTNPLGGIIRSYNNIVAAHDELFSSPIKIDVEYYDIKISKLANGFSAVGRERGTMVINGMTIDVGFRTSRLFIKENGEYKQLHHHGSFDDLGTQNKIMETLSKLSA